jgi:hypothetical protein
VRLRRAIVLVVLSLSMLALPSTSVAAAPDFVGITSEDLFAGSSSYRSSTLAQQRAVNIGIIRQTFEWKAMEPTRGNYDFAYYDDYVAAAANQGIEILPIVFRAPKFYRRTQAERPICPPRNYKAMAKFVRALVNRYGPKGSLWRERPGVRKVPIRSWQIWNEPNLKLYWCGKTSAKGYVKMLKANYKAIKKADRKAEIVTAGLPDSLLKSAVRLKKWLPAMYRAKAKKYFDTLAINSYAKNTTVLKNLLRRVRKLAKKGGDRKVKIWITEMGWGDTADSPKVQRHRFIVGAQGQASRITSSLAFIRKNRRKLRLRGFVYYSWRDAPPYLPGKDMWGLHTGLLTKSGAKKPAYFAFQSAASKF